MTSPTEWLKVIQLKPRFLFGLLVLGLMLLLFPDSWATRFGFQGIRDSFRGWIGIGTLCALAFWLIQLIPFWRETRAIKRHKASVIDAISSLSPEEQMLLAFCVDRNQRTLTLEITHRVANALKSKGMLVAATGTGNSLAWAFTIPSHLWDYLQQNRESLFPESDLKHPNVQAEFDHLDAHMRRHDRRGWL